jgi:glycosyltransferase involved in cell wall biosynthesis
LNTATLTPCSTRRDTRPGLVGKRAAVIVFSYYPSDTRVFRAAEALQVSGMEVDVFCILETPNEPRRSVVNAVQVHRLRLLKRRTSKFAYIYQYGYFLMAAFAWLTGQMLTRRYSLVHVHNMPDVLVFSALVAKLLGARVVLDLHDPTPEVYMAIYRFDVDSAMARWLRRLERWSIGFSNLVLTPNVAFAECFVSRGCPPGKIEVVMNSPLASVFHLPEHRIKSRHLPGDRRPFVLMYHGTLVERHGLHTAVEAVARVRATIPDLRFHIYGQQTAYMNETVWPLIKSLGLEKAVECFGEQPQSVIAESIAACDLGVVPNLRTVFTEINMPTRIFEYLALQKPVIVPDSRGIRDYFDDSQMLYFEPGNAADLASKIAWVYQNPRETDRWVEAGRAVYRQHLWEQERERFLDSVTELCCA